MTSSVASSIPAFLGPVHVEIPIDFDKHISEAVYGIDGVNDMEDDEFVTTEYKGVRDVDG